ncbi:phage replisome organizer N-terminal domain-containing protein [Clostridium estertheticum]|uniref:phage replisome organizer N-terminal domain-containing protein n=1 Tax=Clostridium estertheticum TaxID=238834 RepID=UPI001C6F0D39|nr:phage replisome organizer N-terminal domain-containing protein [Clostridium estertheticum]MBW9154258.1 phage replisome organizer N-terminal domain-containing protein [Clostridium estertheticum]WLC86685.1 phage replisome organizer N-terminal domain-containing protein [Clostridium estertheticum]
MNNAKKYYWLKLKEDFFRQKEIKKLRKIAGGDTYTIIYLKMQLLSLKKEGRLNFDGIEDNFAAEMALEIDEEFENVQVTIMYLIKFGLLEELNENEYLMKNATLSIGNETQGAERVRRFREKEKLLLCNAPVTKCNTEIREKRKELDIELEIEIDKKKKLTIKHSLSLLISDYTKNEELKNTLVNFIEMRKANKSTPTDKALTLIFNKLNKLANTDNDKIAILEQSIMNSWKSIFEIKEGKYGSSKQNNESSSTEDYDFSKYTG